MNTDSFFINFDRQTQKQQKLSELYFMLYIVLYIIQSIM